MLDCVWAQSADKASGALASLQVPCVIAVTVDPDSVEYALWVEFLYHPHLAREIPSQTFQPSPGVGCWTLHVSCKALHGFSYVSPVQAEICCPHCNRPILRHLSWLQNQQLFCCHHICQFRLLTRCTHRLAGPKVELLHDVFSVTRICFIPDHAGLLVIANQPVQHTHGRPIWLLRSYLAVGAVLELRLDLVLQELQGRLISYCNKIVSVHQETKVFSFMDEKRRPPNTLSDACVLEKLNIRFLPDSQPFRAPLGGHRTHVSVPGR